MKRWKATHRITRHDASGDRRYSVMLLERPGPAYTKLEWEYGENADFEVDGRGRWRFQGQAFEGSILALPLPRKPRKGLTLPATWARLPELRRLAKSQLLTAQALACQVLNEFLSNGCSAYVMYQRGIAYGRKHPKR